MRIIVYKLGENNVMFTSIIKEFLGTKMAKCNERKLKIITEHESDDVASQGRLWIISDNSNLNAFIYQLS